MLSQSSEPGDKSHPEFTFAALFIGANPRSVLYGHPLTSNATQKGTDVMSLHPNFASVPSWRSCTAGKHIFSAAMSAKHMGNKRGVPRE
jgi:hypothetical protein